MENIVLSKAVSAFCKAHKEIKRGTKIVIPQQVLDKIAKDRPGDYLDFFHKYYRSFDDQHWVSLDTLAEITEYCDSVSVWRFFSAFELVDGELVVKHMFLVDRKELGIKLMSRKTADRSKTLAGTASRTRRR